MALTTAMIEAPGSQNLPDHPTRAIEEIEHMLPGDNLPKLLYRIMGERFYGKIQYMFVFVCGGVPVNSQWVRVSFGTDGWVSLFALGVCCCLGAVGWGSGGTLPIAM